MKKIFLCLLLLLSCSEENVRILKGKEAYVGMKRYERCEDAPYLVFPKPGRVFTTEGVRFPIRLIAFKGHRIVFDGIIPPGRTVTIPEADLVIEIPVCDRRKFFPRSAR